MSKLIWGIIIFIIIVIIVVVVLIMTTMTTSMTTTSTGALEAGCTQCATSGFFSCPAGIINSTGTDSWNGLAGRVSTYYLEAYDPADPNVQIGNTKYYWRDGLSACGTD